MSSIGPLSPGTCEDSAAVGTVSWSNPDNAKVSDNVYATVTLVDDYSHYLKANNFGFAIPIGATINGIKVDIEGKTDSGGSWYFDLIELIKGGVIGGSNKSGDAYFPVGTSDTYISFGGTTDLWGLTWIPAQINASDFGLAITTSGISTIISIDHIRITVYYTELIVGPFPTFFQT